MDDLVQLHDEDERRAQTRPHLSDDMDDELDETEELSSFLQIHQYEHELQKLNDEIEQMDEMALVQILPDEAGEVVAVHDELFIQCIEQEVYSLRLLLDEPDEVGEHELMDEGHEQHDEHELHDNL